MYMEDTFRTLAKYTLIIIILGFLGINVFYYLGRTADVAVDITKDVVGSTAGAVSKTIDIAEEGAETSVDIIAGATKDAIKVSGGVLSGSLKDIESTLDERSRTKTHQEPTADESNSSVQEPRKSGYCYIGTEKGFRTCMYVGKQDMCSSKKIFPTMEICMNPNLRV